MTRGFSILHGDALVELGKLDAASFDACLCDPPYGLSFMGKSWDKGVPPAEMWAALLRVLKPGAHLLAFGGTRTYHRLTCAIEDAGFEIRDCCMWLYGSGFPKSHDISKGIDKAAGAERSVIRSRTVGRGSIGNRSRVAQGYRPTEFNPEGIVPITAPATPAAQTWNGFGTALKPSFEPLIVAVKPFPVEAERRIIVESLIRLDSQLWSLLPASIAEKHFGLSRQEQSAVLASAQWGVSEAQNIRADLFGQMDTSQFVTVMSSCLNIVSSWAVILDENSGAMSTSTIGMESGRITGYGTLKSYLSALTPHTIIQAAIRQPGSWWNALPAARYLNAVATSTSATRELFALECAIEQGHTLRPDGIAQGTNFRPIIVAMKPCEGTFAENALQHGVAGLNIDAGRIAHSDPVKLAQRTSNKFSGNNFNGGKAGHYRTNTETASAAPSGRWPANVLLDEDAAVMLDDAADSGGASRFFYIAKADGSERNAGLSDRNIHPTVKPVDLTAYLAKLILPPERETPRRIVVPFSGSGSEIMGALRAGWDEAVGVEIDAKYIAIARQRITGDAPLFNSESLTGEMPA